jgi:peptidyl-prolyl cis-trans isomerase SurA
MSIALLSISRTRRPAAQERAIVGAALLLALGYVSTSAHAGPQKSPIVPKQQSEVVLDAVIASVDEKPITLSELSSRMTPPRKLALSEVAVDSEAQKTLDALTFERILEAEAALKRVTVEEMEVEEYTNEVARRNALSRPDFEALLAKEGKSIDWYKHQVKSDILKTKLAGNISRGGISVSETEIDEYLTHNPVVKTAGASVKLRVLSISTVGRSTDEVTAKIQEVEGALAAGEDFGEVAKRLSDGANKEDGGSLGIIAQADLSSDVATALNGVEAGSHTKPVSTGDALQIFFVEERFGSDDSADTEPDENEEKARREEARKAIQKQKTDEKLSAYFSTEIYKNHPVDKKF